MQPVLPVEFTCPYCWQTNTAAVECADGQDQTMTVDCEVCCRPVVLRVHLDDDGAPMIDATAELS